MSEPGIATKAPESDAMEDVDVHEEQAAPNEAESMIPKDTPAQTGASMGVSSFDARRPDGQLGLTVTGTLYHR